MRVESSWQCESSCTQLCDQPWELWLLLRIRAFFHALTYILKVFKYFIDIKRGKCRGRRININVKAEHQSPTSCTPLTEGSSHTWACALTGIEPVILCVDNTQPTEPHRPGLWLIHTWTWSTVTLTQSRQRPVAELHVSQCVCNNTSSYTSFLLSHFSFYKKHGQTGWLLCFIVHPESP